MRFTRSRTRSSVWKRTPVTRSRLMPAQRENQFEQEEFFKDETVMIWRVAIVELGQVVGFVGEVDPVQGGPQIRKDRCALRIRREADRRGFLPESFNADETIRRNCRLVMPALSS